MLPFTQINSNISAVPIVASIPHTGTYVPEDIEQLFTNSDVAELPMTD